MATQIPRKKNGRQAREHVRRSVQNRPVRRTGSVSVGGTALYQLDRACAMCGLDRRQMVEVLIGNEFNGALPQMEVPPIEKGDIHFHVLTCWRDREADMLMLWDIQKALDEGRGQLPEPLRKAIRARLPTLLPPKPLRGSK